MISRARLMVSFTTTPTSVVFHVPPVYAAGQSAGEIADLAARSRAGRRRACSIEARRRTSAPSSTFFVGIEHGATQRRSASSGWFYRGMREAAERSRGVAGWSGRGA